MPLPGQLPYANPAIQAGFSQLAKQRDAADQRRHSAESILRHHEQQRDHWQQRQRGAEQRLTRARRAAEASEGTTAEATLKQVVAQTEDEINYWKAKAVVEAKRAEEARPFADKARQEFDRLEHRMKALADGVVA